MPNSKILVTLLVAASAVSATGSKEKGRSIAKACPVSPCILQACLLGDSAHQPTSDPELPKIQQCGAALTGWLWDIFEV